MGMGRAINYIWAFSKDKSAEGDQPDMTFNRFSKFKFQGQNCCITASYLLR